jgi:hypothetical protein
VHDGGAFGVVFYFEGIIFCNSPYLAQVIRENPISKTPALSVGATFSIIFPLWGIIIRALFG